MAKDDLIELSTTGTKPSLFLASLLDRNVVQPNPDSSYSPGALLKDVDSNPLPVPEKSSGILDLKNKHEQNHTSIFRWSSEMAITIRRFVTSKELDFLKVHRS